MNTRLLCILSIMVFTLFLSACNYNYNEDDLIVLVFDPESGTYVRYEIPEPIAAELLPGSLAEVFKYFNENLSPEDIEYVKNFEFDDLILLHMGWGLGIRNAWLWRADTGIFFELSAMGITHPDSMSQFIIEAYHLYLNGLDYMTILQHYFN